MKWLSKWDWKIKSAVIILLVAVISFFTAFIVLQNKTKFRETGGQVQTQEKPAPVDKMINQYYGRFTASDMLSKNYILAFYGQPQSKTMGIVGRYSKEELAVKLEEQARAYAALNPQKGVIPAFYLIYGTCQPKGEIYRLPKSLLQSYLDFALEKGYLVYLDHQIGKYKPEDAFQELLPYLKYPNVHLAVDVEWRTNRPMRKIGHITAQELNNLQKIMKDYMVQNKIPGRKQLVFHQFKPYMVTNIEKVSAAYDPVILIHSTSGWGPPSLKIDTHGLNAKAANIPLKAFKLWYFYSHKKGVHYDDPLMTPAQVLSLRPEPSLIIYQ